MDCIQLYLNNMTMDCIQKEEDALENESKSIAKK